MIPNRANEAADLRSDENIEGRGEISGLLIDVLLEGEEVDQFFRFEGSPL